MAAEQSMTEAIMQAAIKATKETIMATREAENPVNNARPVHTAPRSGGLASNQSTFDWKAADKYQELYNFWNKGKNHFHN